MENRKGIRGFLGGTTERWYVCVGILLALILADYGFLGLVIPSWGCELIALVLLVLLVLYVAVWYQLLRQHLNDTIVDR